MGEIIAKHWRMALMKQGNWTLICSLCLNPCLRMGQDGKGKKQNQKYQCMIGGAKGAEMNKTSFTLLAPVVVTAKLII